MEVWEHEFNDERKRDPELDALVKRYIKTINSEPLSLRDCLYGGRTEVFRHHIDVEEDGGTIHYDDVLPHFFQFYQYCACQVF